MKKARIKAKKIIIKDQEHFTSMQFLKFNRVLIKLDLECTLFNSWNLILLVKISLKMI